MQFTGATAQEYRQVHTNLGLDPDDPSVGEWPTGLVSHTGSTNDRGQLIVFEVWQSRDAQQAFLEARLGEALAKAGVSPPEQSEWLFGTDHHHRAVGWGRVALRRS
jgi:hypothetical protein